MGCELSLFCNFFSPLLWWHCTHLPGVLSLKAKFLNLWWGLRIWEIRGLKHNDTIYERFPLSNISPNLKLYLFLFVLYLFWVFWMQIRLHWIVVVCNSVTKHEPWWSFNYFVIDCGLLHSAIIDLMCAFDQARSAWIWRLEAWLWELLSPFVFYNWKFGQLNFSCFPILFKLKQWVWVYCRHLFLECSQAC